VGMGRAKMCATHGWSIGVSGTQRYLENGSRSDQWAQWRPPGNSWATVVRQSTVATDSFFRRITVLSSF
ncbi:hypothetical protein BDQ94DRAFT_155059, partial [Aspergillus welwitschiae]